MKTSIAMATYNGASYLLEQLDSLRTQSMEPDEVVICDDRSKDETVQMIKDYIHRFQLQDKWRVLVNDRNLGYADNFFQAMMKTKGDYIFFCDQDDIWCKDKLDSCVKIMEEHQEIQLLCTDYTPFVSAENAPNVPEKVKKQMLNDGSLQKIELNKRNIYIRSLGCDMCIRKSFRDQIAPFHIKGWAHDDFVWKTAQCVDGCYWYHKSLLKRRLHDHNVSMHKIHNKKKRVDFLNELANANTSMLDFAKSVKIDRVKANFIKRTVKACRLRKELVEKKRIQNVFPLLFYMDCYQSKKSILMEPYIALRGKE